MRIKSTDISFIVHYNGIYVCESTKANYATVATAISAPDVQLSVA